MTSGCNNFNYFPENQLTKSKLYPLTSSFLSYEDFYDYFASPGVPLDAPARFLLAGTSKGNLLPLSSASSPLSPLPSFLCPLPQLSIPSSLFPFPPSLVPALALNALTLLNPEVCGSAVSSPSGSGPHTLLMHFTLKICATFITSIIINSYC